MKGQQRRDRDLIQALLKWLELHNEHYDCPTCGEPGIAAVGEILKHTRRHNMDFQARARLLVRECPGLAQSLRESLERHMGANGRGEGEAPQSV